MQEWLEPRVVGIGRQNGENGDGDGANGAAAAAGGESVEPLDRVLSGIWNMWQSSRE